MADNCVSGSFKGTPNTIWSLLSVAGLKEVLADIFKPCFEWLFWEQVKVALLFVLCSWTIAEDMEVIDKRVSFPRHV